MWQAYSISELGSAVGAGALPLVAVLLLDCSALQVSLLAVVSGVASAVVALPLGPWVEFRPKRPVMIGADVLRCAALASVPAAALLGRLTYGQLCVVAVAQTAGGIVFAAASGAHLRDLVPAEHRVAVYGRFETSQWMAHSAGSPAGGVLVSWLGATASIAVDAGSFLLSAVAVHRLRGPEPPPPVRRAAGSRAREAIEGWRYILGHSGLRALLVNAVIFGGGIMAAAPVVAVFMLRDLHLPPWQYGLAFGLPCLGGILGSLTAGALVRRHGLRPVLLATGAARALWMGLIPAAPPGTRAGRDRDRGDTAAVLRRLVQPRLRRIPREPHHRAADVPGGHGLVDHLEADPARLRPGRRHHHRHHRRPHRHHRNRRSHPHQRGIPALATRSGPTRPNRPATPRLRRAGARHTPADRSHRPHAGREAPATADRPAPEREPPMSNTAACWTDAALVSIDLEGTGGHDRDQEAILELALVPLHDGTPQPSAALATLVNPARPLDHRARLPPGVSRAALRAAPILADLEPYVVDLVTGRYLIGHHVAVDWRLLRRQLPRLRPAGLLDTLRLSRAVAPGAGHSLTTVIDRLGLTTRVNASSGGSRPHRALWDATAAALLLPELAARLWDTPPSLAQLIRRAGIPMTPDTRHTDAPPRLF
ncbi:MFS transporter [Micromonospora aurantiaca]|uniref:MFS transporter n=1 Tax=Micromonospora aurantiaca (nom. illeg.) TaxID=47850 RepID=UPI0033D921B1